jgi:hypothetical protein
MKSAIDLVPVVLLIILTFVGIFSLASRYLRINISFLRKGRPCWGSKYADNVEIISRHFNKKNKPATH